MKNNIIDYVENGFRIFPLWEFDEKGCKCPNDHCNQAGKHPAISSWSQVPHWSDDQLENMVEYSIKTGFGVVVENHLIVDIDPRNGGEQSFSHLCMHLGLDLKKECGFEVYTGGGGSHLYFKLPEGNESYQQVLQNYRGIDFKTSGFVVGAGSLHVSGKSYFTEDHLGEIKQAPTALLKLLKRPEQFRASYNGTSIDLNNQEIEKMLSHISPDCEYEKWIRCGMALHQATAGTSFDLWDNWSATGKDYPGSDTLQRHWASFGKSSNPVSIGTLIHYAEEGGYEQSVTYSAPIIEEEDNTGGDMPFDVNSVDLLRPPGLVGELTSFINSNSRYPREHLAVATALTCLSNIAGLRYIDKRDGITMNLMSLCVAGSATGKEAILQSAIAIHKAVGIERAVVGNIKSEQEIVRNLVRHQASYYLIDEVGYLLQKIEKARKSGGASYFDGVIATIMSVFSKADSTFLISGDLKETVAFELKKELVQAEKKVEEQEDDTGYYAARAEYIRDKALKQLDAGLERPFLSVLGMTTPVSFDGLVSDEQATNGFIGRCFLVREHETNPRRKKGFIKQGYKLSAPLKATLQNLFDGGYYDTTHNRVEFLGRPVHLPTASDADAALDKIADWLEDYAEHHKGTTGLEPIVRRSYELMAKISLILAIGEGVRTVEHVRWSFALMVQDMHAKISLATMNRQEGADNVQARVIDAIGKGDGERESVIIQRACRAKGVSRLDVEKALQSLVALRRITLQQKTTPKGRSFNHYCLS